MKRYVSALLLALVGLAPLSALAAARQDRSASHARQVVIRGEVRCMDGSGKLRVKGECDVATDRYALIESGERIYRFLPEDTMTAMLADARVRERLLQVTALLHAGDRLEIIKVHSVKQGKLYDIYYFCDVCNITAYAPGPCACCGEQMQFKETPAPRR